MDGRWKTAWIPASFALTGVAAIGLWLSRSGAYIVVTPRLPGEDRLGMAATTAPASVDLMGTFSKGPGEASKVQGQWTGFRGGDYDNIGKENPPLATSLKDLGGRRLWEVSLGEGYAGPAVRDGRVYVLDYDARERADVVRCLSLDDGREIWRRAYSVDVKRNHGMSRTVPAVSDKYVVTLGPKCHLLCLDRTTGDYRWGIDMARRYETKVPPWYAGQCPLIDEDRAIIAPGGKVLMAAMDCASGKVIWETPNPRGWEMTHSSIMPMEFGGVKMFVYCGSGGVAGVDAATGKLLWESSAWRVKIATVPSPVPLGDGRILLTGGYDAGSSMIRLEPAGELFKVQTLWTQKAAVFGAEQQTPVFYKGAIYGVIPGGQLVCLDPATGTPRWNSGQTRFGIGPYLIANEVIYLTSDTGTLSLVKADDREFQLLDSGKAIETGHECWGPMALAGGRLLVRDLTRMVCLDVTIQALPPQAETRKPAQVAAP